MVEFEPLTPDPPDPSYTVEVNGDTQQVNPPPDADRIVIETQQQEKTEYRTSTANIGSSYAESSWGGNRTYNPKSFGPSHQQWHKNVRNMSFDYDVYASAWEYDGSSNNSAYLNVVIKFKNRENVDFRKDVQVESRYGDSERESKRGTFDVGNGEITEIYVAGSGPRTDYNHAVEYNYANVDFTADVPVEFTEAAINNVTVE